MFRFLFRLRFFLLLLLPAGLPLAAQTDPDSALLDEMQARMQALRKQAVETEDSAERARLQAKIGTVLDETLAQVSPKGRPMIEISFRVLRPLADDGAVYSAAAAAVFDTLEADLRQLKSRDELAKRIAALERLEAMNLRLLEQMNGAETAIEKLLKNSGLPAAEQRNFLAGYRNSSGRRMGAARAVRNLDAKMLALWKDALRLLDKTWGRWRPDGDGQLVWDDKSAEKKLAALMGEIVVLGERQSAAERSLLNSK
jgi:hypothetical protein